MADLPSDWFEEYDGQRLVLNLARVETLWKAAKLYEKWATETKDYPHDEQGCEAHDAILEAIKDSNGAGQ